MLANVHRPCAPKSKSCPPVFPSRVADALMSPHISWLALAVAVGVASTNMLILSVALVQGALPTAVNLSVTVVPASER